MKLMLRLGSRGSPLALQQAQIVRSKILKKYSDLSVNIQTFKTQGDKLLKSPLSKIGGQGVFVKELEEALLSREIDVAVHSLKDLPIDIPRGLKVAVVLKREEWRDAYISRCYPKFLELPKGARVGTSSLRRKIQVLRLHPTVKMIDIRGNVQTRLKKLDRGGVDALIMSAVGLERLGMGDQIREFLNFLPAVGQGALALEIREDDSQTLKIVSFLNDKNSFLATQLERLFLKYLGGGCQVPVGCLTKIYKNSFVMKTFIGSLDDKIFLEHKIKGSLDKANHCVMELSQKILKNGGRKILESIHVF